MIPALYLWIVAVTVAALGCEWTGRQHLTERVMGAGVAVAAVWLLAVAVQVS